MNVLRKTMMRGGLRGSGRQRLQLRYSAIGTMNRKSRTFLSRGVRGVNAKFKFIAIVVMTIWILRCCTRAPLRSHSHTLPRTLTQHRRWWELFVHVDENNNDVAQRTSLRKPLIVKVIGDTMSTVVSMPIVLHPGRNDLDPDFNWPIRRRRVVRPSPNHLTQTLSSDEEERQTCRAFPWQLQHFPTCNIMHELGLGQLRTTSHRHGGGRPTDLQYINSGFNRAVWRLGDDGNEVIALKTLIMEKEITKRLIEKQKHDAIISERSTASENIVDIFAYCGTSALNEFSFGGTLEDAYHTLEKNERLRVAVDVAKALADLHSLGAVVHADIAVRQYLDINGRFKLNDFNTSGMMYRNVKTGGICPFEIGEAGDKNRAPEEMIPPYLVTEAIDVYSMGNIFYKLLTNKRKYDNISTFDAQNLIIRGQEPELSQDIQNSSHKVDIALRNAIEMCLKRSPEDRKSAEEVYRYLSRSLTENKSTNV